MKYSLLIGSLLVLSSTSTLSAHNHKEEHTHQSVSQKIHFIENKGQWENNVKYKADIPNGGMVLYTTEGFFFNYVSLEDRNRIHMMEHEGASEAELKKQKERGHAYKVNFVGRNKPNDIKTTERRSFYQNYFLGNNPSKWKGNVGLFGGIEEQNVYNGIDIKLYGSENNNLKYDFIVAPGANPNQIQLAFDGIQPELTKDGQLKLKFSFNEIFESAPYTYQIIDGKKVTVPSKYVIQDGRLSFAFPEGYNKNYSLVIDPELIFATYSGGTGSTSYYAQGTSYDLDGNMYVAALSSGVGWPTTAGAYQTAYGGGGHDIAINKYSPDGINLIFSTYLGGSGADLPTSVRANPAGDFYVVGQSASSDYPVTTGAYQANNNGGASDIIVTHLNAAGSGLLGSTYIGGSAADGSPIEGNSLLGPVSNTGPATGPVELIITENGDIIVVSNTQSTNFPVSGNAAQGTFGGGDRDGVIFKMNPTLTTLIYSSFIGGSGTDAAFDVKVNSVGEVIVCGQTNSTNFNVGSGGFKASNSGGIDGWVLRLNGTSFGILSGTYLGTGNDDHASKVSLDCNDNVYIAGRSANGTYPVSSGVYSMTNGSVYIQKLNNTLSTGMLSTVVGQTNTSLNTGGYIITGFMVDICGLVYVSGIGATNGLPTTPDAFQVGQAPFYGMVLEPNFNDLYFATYYGASGAHQHTGNSHMDPEGRVYQSNCYSGGAFPIFPPNVFSPNQANTGLDMVSFKFDFEANPVKIAGETPEGGNIPNNHAIRGCKSAFLHYTRSADPEPMIIRYEIAGTAVNGVDYQWIPDSIIIQPNEDSAVLEIKALLGPATGPKTVIINTYSPCACEGSNDRIVSSDTVIILDSLYVNIPVPTDTSCPKDLVTIIAEIDPTLNYYWEPANLIQDATGTTIQVDPTVTTTYSITVSQPGAPATCPTRTKSYRAYVEPYPIISFPNDIQTICLSNDSFPLLAYVEPAGINYRYVWSPTTHIRDATTPVNKFYAPVGSYTMKVTISTPGAGCSTTDSMVINVVPPFEFESITPADTTIKLGDKVQINSIGDAVMWYWTPMEFLNDPMIPNPIATPKENTLYRLVGFDKYGCTDTGYVNINVKHTPDIYIPNAFSPNGDGFNDVFKIVNLTYEKLVSFRVYNRLGELVFETQDPNKGWDGTYNGKPAPNDVYFYHIQVTPPLELKPIEFKGDVTLLR